LSNIILCLKLFLNILTNLIRFLISLFKNLFFEVLFMGKQFFILLSLLSTTVTAAQAIRTNGVNTDDEYIALGQHQNLSGVGCIYKRDDTGNTGWCTGTLVNDTGTVVTCAHSFDPVIREYVEAHPDSLHFWTKEGEAEREQDIAPLDHPAMRDYFRTMEQTEIESLSRLIIPLDNCYMDFSPEYQVTPRIKINSVLVNPLYMLGLKEDSRTRFNFDNAVVKLEQTPEGLTPIPVLSVGMGEPERALFAGYEAGDNHDLPLRRASYVCNLPVTSNVRQGGAFSSVFFNPASKPSLSLAPGPLSASHWRTVGQPLYGHGENGDSGGPLVVMQGGELRLIGTVKGGALKQKDGPGFDEPDLSVDKSQLYNRLYTVFAPLVNATSYGMFTNDLVRKMLKVSQ
jgi:hypothetical protein